MLKRLVLMAQGLGFQERLGFLCLGFRVLGFRDLGFRVLGLLGWYLRPTAKRVLGLGFSAVAWCSLLPLRKFGSS